MKINIKLGKYPATIEIPDKEIKILVKEFKANDFTFEDFKDEIYLYANDIFMGIDGKVTKETAKELQKIYENQS